MIGPGATSERYLLEVRWGNKLYTVHGHWQWEAPIVLNMQKFSKMFYGRMRNYTKSDFTLEMLNVKNQGATTYST